MRLLIVLAFIGAAMAVPKNIQRIVGGEPTTIERYNFMAGMMYGTYGANHRQACGGTIITTTAVVSAAHCFQGDFSSQWRIRVGTSYTTGGTVLRISTWNFHENYTPALILNDIIVIRMPAVTLSASVGVARIAGPNYHLPDNTRVYAAGWGRLSDGGASPTVLQHVDLNVINQALCTQRYAYLKTQIGFFQWPDVTPDMICLGILDIGGKDTCAGDSGGPAVHQGDILVGITSWGYSCAHHFYPGVSVRVSSYTNWIIRNAMA